MFSFGYFPGVWVLKSREHNITLNKKTAFWYRLQHVQLPGSSTAQTADTLRQYGLPNLIIVMQKPITAYSPRLYAPLHIIIAYFHEIPFNIIQP